jgi:hypothetical protein
MIAALLAAFGAFLFWQCRDDDTERVAGLALRTGSWKVIIMAVVGPLLYVQADALWQFGVAVALFIFVLTAPHNLLLSPPEAYPLPKPRDPLQSVLFNLFDKVPGDALTQPMYWTYSLLRQSAPVSGMGVALDSFALIAAGPVASLIYYPWRHSERSKYVRAGAFGALLGAAIGWGLQ